MEQSNNHKNACVLCFCHPILRIFFNFFPPNQVSKKNRFATARVRRACAAKENFWFQMTHVRWYYFGHFFWSKWECAFFHIRSENCVPHESFTFNLCRVMLFQVTHQKLRTRILRHKRKCNSTDQKKRGRVPLHTAKVQEIKVKFATRLSRTRQGSWNRHASETHESPRCPSVFPLSYFPRKKTPPWKDTLRMGLCFGVDV